jgi:hypothetical protein
MLLRARRGGVAVGSAASNLDHAVDAQIQLEVLVHRFSTEEGGPFGKAAAEGMKQVQEANQLALAALEELEFRRRGLAASLVIVLLVLIGLGLRIRELSRRRAAGEPHRGPVDRSAGDSMRRGRSAAPAQSDRDHERYGPRRRGSNDGRVVTASVAGSSCVAQW